jgi:hypothetical protein
VPGLGLLPGSACAHFDTPMRRAAFPDLVRSGLVAGVAAEDDVALVFDGTDLVEAVSSATDRRAFRVGPGGEVELPVRRI